MLPRRWVTWKTTALVLVLSVTVAASAWLLRTSNAELRLTIVRLQRHENDDEVWSVAETLLERDPRDAQSLLLLADVCERTGRFAVAKECLEKLQRSDTSRSLDCSVRLAAIEMKQHQVAEAEARLNAILSEHPDSIGALRLKAQIAGVLAKSSELSALLLKIVQLDSFTQNDLLVLASSNAFIDDENRLKFLSEVDPGNVDVLLPKARNLLNQDHASEAIQTLEELILKRPEHWEAQALLGQLFAAEDDADFLRWHSRLPKGADAFGGIWFARGLWLERKGETRPAARCFYEALNREPELLSAVSHLSQCVRLNGETKIAQMLSDRARLMLKVRDLATRMDEQQTFRWAPELIDTLETLGQRWEAWAWSLLLAKSTPMDLRWKSRTAALARNLNEVHHRTDPKFRFELTLDWSKVTLPDWSQYSSTESADTTWSRLSRIHFRDDAHEVGLHFTYLNKAGLPGDDGNLIYESTGGGAGVVDIDADSWPDVYCVQGGALHSPEKSPSDALFRNRRGRTFVDVSSDAGIHEQHYGQGIAVGDINNDGFGDIYVANIGRNQLLLNNGDGTLSDVSSTLEVTDARWTISAGIADLNRDGHPEIIDVNYCDGQEPLTTVCMTETQKPRACRPTIFGPAPDVQLFNQGDGTFAESVLDADSRSAGGRGMGLIIADFDGNQNPDLFVANDQSPNHLFLNQFTTPNEPATFHDEALVRGVGLDRDGFALAFMGVAASDLNRDGTPDLFVTTFAQETPTLFVSQPGGHFIETTREAELRAPCFPTLGFGTQFLDADLDGLAELLILNGHIDSFPDSDQPYQMKPQIFRGLPDGRFAELEPGKSGEFFTEPRLGRALTLLDWNKDGRDDFIATDLAAPTAICTNDSETFGRALRLRFVGTSSSRDAIGAAVTVEGNGSHNQIVQLMAGNGYESSNERVVSIVTQPEDVVTRISILWPSGTTDILANAPTGEFSVVIEGRSLSYVIPR